MQLPFILTLKKLSSSNKEMPLYGNIHTAHGTETQTDGNYEEVKRTVEIPFTMEHNMAYSTTTHTSTTAAQ